MPFSQKGGFHVVFDNVQTISSLVDFGRELKLGPAPLPSRINGNWPMFELRLRKNGCEWAAAEVGEWESHFTILNTSQREAASRPDISV